MTTTTMTTTVTTFTLDEKNAADTSNVTLEACVEHEALFTCEQGRHGHCRRYAPRLHDQHRDFRSAVLRSGGADTYRVLHLGTFPIVVTSTASECSFIHLHDIVSLSSSSSPSICSSPLHAYTHLTTCSVPSPLSPDLSFSRLYSTWSSRRSTVILSLSRSRSPLTCLSLFPLRRSPLALSRPLCHSLALTRLTKATRVLLPTCATRAKALVRLNSDKTSATPSTQVAAPAAIISPTSHELRIAPPPRLRPNISLSPQCFPPVFPFSLSRFQLMVRSLSSSPLPSSALRSPLSPFFLFFLLPIYLAVLYPVLAGPYPPSVFTTYFGQTYFSIPPFFLTFCTLIHLLHSSIVHCNAFFPGITLQGRCSSYSLLPRPGRV